MTTMTMIAVPVSILPGQQLEVDGLRAAIVGDLVEIGIELNLLMALAHAPRQLKNILVSADALLEQDEMIRKSRKDLKLERARGMNPAVISRPPAPVTILDLITQIHGALVAHETRAWRLICAVPARTRHLDLTDQQRLAQLEARVLQVWDLDWLRDVDADLRRLIAMSKALLDGEPKSLMDALCPWCEQKTLIIYKAQGFIRCEKQTHDGPREACLCSAGDDCGCTRGRQHTWKRSDGGWERLAGMLKRAKP